MSTRGRLECIYRTKILAGCNDFNTSGGASGSGSSKSRSTCAAYIALGLAHRQGPCRPVLGQQWGLLSTEEAAPEALVALGAL